MCKDIRKYFLSHRVVGRWNALDQHMVDALSINAFKQRLDKLRHTIVTHFCLTWVISFPCTRRCFSRCSCSCFSVSSLASLFCFISSWTLHNNHPSTFSRTSQACQIHEKPDWCLYSAGFVNQSAIKWNKNVSQHAELHIVKSRNNTQCDTLSNTFKEFVANMVEKYNHKVNSLLCMKCLLCYTCCECDISQHT